MPSTFFCAWANTVGRISPSDMSLHTRFCTPDMHLHTRCLCKIHHNCLAAPSQPSCYVQIHQNTFHIKIFHGREDKEVFIEYYSIIYFIHSIPIGLLILLLKTMHTRTKQALYIYLVPISAAGVSFSGGTYQRGLLLTAALRAWPPSSLPHYDALHCDLRGTWAR